MVEYDGLDVVLLGDLNSRVETCMLQDIRKGLCYLNSEDEMLNSNGRKLIQLCKDNDLAVINNLCYNDKTFKSHLLHHNYKEPKIRERF